MCCFKEPTCIDERNNARCGIHVTLQLPRLEHGQRQECSAWARCEETVLPQRRDPVNFALSAHRRWHSNVPQDLLQLKLKTSISLVYMIVAHWCLAILA